MNRFSVLAEKHTFFLRKLNKEKEHNSRQVRK